MTEMNSANVPTPNDTTSAEDEAYYLASSWQLMRRKFLKHKLAIAGGLILLVFYIAGPVLAGFFATTDSFLRHRSFVFAPPQAIRVWHEGRPRLPFVYGLDPSRDPETLRRLYAINKTLIYPIQFFVRGTEYKLLGLFETDLHFMGVTEGTMFLFGTDELGRDMYSRTVRGARVSLTIGLFGVTISFILGLLLGGISGYFGGAPDMLIQRIIEFLISIPSIPLWMTLAAAVPVAWPPPTNVLHDHRHPLDRGLDRSGPGGTRKAAPAPGGGLRHGGQGLRRLGSAYHRPPPAARFHELPGRPPDAGGAGHDPR